MKTKEKLIWEASTVDLDGEEWRDRLEQWRALWAVPPPLSGVTIYESEGGTFRRIPPGDIPLHAKISHTKAARD